MPALLALDPVAIAPVLRRWARDDEIETVMVNAKNGHEACLLRCFTSPRCS